MTRKDVKKLNERIAELTCLANHKNGELVLTHQERNELGRIRKRLNKFNAGLMEVTPEQRFENAVTPLLQRGITTEQIMEFANASYQIWKNSSWYTVERLVEDALQYSPSLLDQFIEKTIEDTKL